MNVRTVTENVLIQIQNSFFFFFSKFRILHRKYIVILMGTGKILSLANFLF